ncbi:MAG TPA: hypothetical protein VFT78_09565 [Hanamia sp.]|nr:hypothetical protein [Hanamia sp.]
MSVPIAINITKEILRKSKECGTRNDIEKIGNNCAIAVALKDVFPNVFVTPHHIYPFGIIENEEFSLFRISLPVIAHNFIKVFDALRCIPNARLCLPEFEFEVFLPDELIAQINIDEVKDMLRQNCIPAN